eukprot:7352230-Alexandrium_andersonii.AAC.1
MARQGRSVVLALVWLLVPLVLDAAPENRNDNESRKEHEKFGLQQHQAWENYGHEAHGGWLSGSAGLEWTTMQGMAIAGLLLGLRRGARP